jgi:CheY-like chemotaxis protein
MRVLVADDSIVSRHLLDATLRKWGYDPVVACDGQEAVSILQSDDAPRLAILDWVMPGYTGPEVCRRLRAEIGKPYIYMIILTSKSHREDLIEGMEAGADDYLTKPFDQHELLVRLRAGMRIIGVMDSVPPPPQPIEFFSCFISHSSQDGVLAEKINNDLRAHGIKSWYAPEDLKIGDRFRLKIDESIRLHDKLLLILSRSSIASSWVEAEVEAALAEENLRSQLAPEPLRGNVTVLFPIRIDDSALESSRLGWAGEVRRTRHIGDFRNWRDPTQYAIALEKLLKDLAATKELDLKAKEERKRLAARQVAR